MKRTLLSLLFFFFVLVPASAQEEYVDLFDKAESKSKKGNYDLAIDLYWESLQSLESQYGKDQGDYAFILDVLALTYSILGDYSTALELQQEVLGLYEKLVGKDSPPAYNHGAILKGWDNEIRLLSA